MSKPSARNGGRKPWQQSIMSMLGGLSWIAFIALSFCAWESFSPIQVSDGLSYHAIEVQ